MCTVTWSVSADGYDLYMNRDELHTRGRADPPGVSLSTNGWFIAPTDPDAGGTWLGVNQHGVTIALLNRYPEGFIPDPSATYSTRGELIPRLMGLETTQAVAEAITGMDLEPYQPFTMVVVEAAPGAHALACAWDAVALTRQHPTMPVVTCSPFQPREVEATRLRSYNEICSERDLSLFAGTALSAYHASHLPEEGPYSVCAHRDDGGTKSFSHVRVHRHAGEGLRVTFAYHDGPPCQEAPEFVVER